MDEDSMPFGEGEDIFYQYTMPSPPAPEEVDPANVTVDLPEETFRDIPSHLVGYEAQPIFESIIDHLAITFGIDIISIGSTILKMILILIATYIAAKMVTRAFKFKIPEMVGGKKTGVDSETELTFRLLISRLLVATVYLIGFIIFLSQIPGLSNVAVTLLAGAGVAAIAIGFAAQDSLSNVISGIFLALFHPFRVGDKIDFKGEYGYIEDLTLRHTTIQTWDGRRIFVPNSIISNQEIVNWTIIDPIILWAVEVRIAYDADIDKAREIMLEAAMRHPLVLKDREIVVRMTGLTELGVNLWLLFEIPSRAVAFATHCEIREAIKKGFDKEGIEIPYPYRNIIFRGPEESDICPSCGVNKEGESPGNLS
ncbi:mechanosensitive ion channel family protein [Candidatus Methanocrinis natronophilus]|uniref:Mechanosensitive ion channel family protein n=1 Tax=Candidatus Methanocrinis natronophilus TaxID=3033396 RepID=A0ABT5X572_9EURY|nr:mechanosensitive ion channel family protein [Candidatus Methanocrinis natronophilus]MDF0589841.1 mechanosensitive ion channel family protein [Candidatus Methanocrinis natronophilus]